MNSEAEIAVKWRPVSDLPHAPCQHWRVRSDSDFRLTVEGDFLVGQTTRTLIVEFPRVRAFAAHDDMGGKAMFAHDIDIPMINGKEVARCPMLKIRNSKWLEANLLISEEHFALLSYECTVEVISNEPTVRWK